MLYIYIFVDLFFWKHFMYYGKQAQSLNPPSNSMDDTANWLLVRNWIGRSYFEGVFEAAANRKATKWNLQHNTTTMKVATTHFEPFFS